MPNHVTNILTISGPEDLVARIKSEISSAYDEDGESVVLHIDFHKIAPLPKELEGTRSPMHIISQEEYDEQERKIAAGETNEPFGPSRCITKEMGIDFLKMFGAVDWYSWQNRNWGTKWNAYSQELLENGDIKFQTAWNTPQLIMMTLSRKYPEAVFTVRFADEDFGHNVGEYTLKGGILTHEDLPDGGSLESLEMAADILNQWEHIRETLENADESDMDETWVKNYLDLAYAKGIFGDYPNWVLKSLLEKASDDGDEITGEKIVKLMIGNSVSLLKEKGLWNDSLDYVENIKQATLKIPALWNEVYVPEDIDPQHLLGREVLKRIGGI